MTLIIIELMAVAGLILTSYILYVQSKLEKDNNYHAACDINEKISCTKVLLTDYSNIFRVSNSSLGFLFYTIIFFLAYTDKLLLIFYLSIPSFIFTMYLFYITYFKVKKYCVICQTTHIINLLIFVISISLLV